MAARAMFGRFRCFAFGGIAVVAAVLTAVTLTNSAWAQAYSYAPQTTPNYSYQQPVAQTPNYSYQQPYGNSNYSNDYNQAPA